MGSQQVSANPRPINLGAVADDGTGDNLRTGGQKINLNFEDIFNQISALATSPTAAVFDAAYAAALPQGVTALSNAGIGTGSGGAAGSYAGGVDGGPPGFAWTYTIGSDGKVASYAITNPGLSNGGAAPTLSYPGGGLAGATVPVATVGIRIAVNAVYWTPSADNRLLVAWKNAGTGVPVAATNADGSQISLTQKAFLDAFLSLFDTTDTLVTDALFAIVAANKTIPLIVNSDGSVSVGPLNSPLISTPRVAAVTVALTDPTGGAGGTLVAEQTDGSALAAVETSNGRDLMVFEPDGGSEMLMDATTRFAGNAYATADVLLTSEFYAPNRRHVWVRWRSGGTYKLTTDNAADHVVEGFDATTGTAVIQQRRGHRLRQLCVDATKPAQLLRPLASRRDIAFTCDSFGSGQLFDYVRANLPDGDSRAIESVGAGGSWITAEVSRILGPRTPNGIGCDGGVVDAQQVGGDPTTAGGVSRAAVTGSMNGSTLTVTALQRGNIQPGDKLIITTGALTVGYAPIVQPFGTAGTTGTGGVGTYNLNGSGNVPDGSTIYAGSWTYPGIPHMWDMTIIIIDGGLDDAGSGTDQVIGRIRALEKLTPLIPRWYYMQSSLQQTSTPSDVSAKLAFDATIAAALGHHYIETYNFMRAHGTGSQVGPNGGQVWPADTQGDGLHPTDYGKSLLGQCIGQHITLYGD